MNLKAIEKFAESKKDFRLTKIGSKRSSSVGVGQTAVGRVSFKVWEATDTLPEQTGVVVSGRGFSSYLRTSPVVKIVDETEDSITFETEGGVYRLEKYEM